MVRTFYFKQLMGTTVGEIDYDEDAQLKKGAPYPEDQAFPIELHLINNAAVEKASRFRSHTRQKQDLKQKN